MVRARSQCSWILYSPSLFEFLRNNDCLLTARTVEGCWGTRATKADPVLSSPRPRFVEAVETKYIDEQINIKLQRVVNAFRKIKKIESNGVSHGG